MSSKGKKVWKIVAIIAAILVIVAIVFSIFMCTNKNKKDASDSDKIAAIEELAAESSAPVPFSGDFDMNDGSNSKAKENALLEEQERQALEEAKKAKEEAEAAKLERELAEKKAVEEAEKLKREQAEKLKLEQAEKQKQKKEAEEADRRRKEADKKAKEQQKNSGRNNNVAVNNNVSKNTNYRNTADTGKNRVSSNDINNNSGNKLWRELDILFGQYVKSDSKSGKDEILNKAVTLSNKILNESQNNDQAHFFLAEDALRNRNISVAESELNKAISIKENYYYYAELGKLQYRKGQYNNAINSFRRSCQLNINYAPSRYNLGLSYVKVNKIDQALSSYKQAIAINPNYEQAYLGMARLYKQVRYYNDAIDAFEKVISINPNNVPARMELGVIYNDRGNYGKAIEMYKAALKLTAPSEIQTALKYNLSVALFNNNSVSEALTVAQESYNEKNYATDISEKANIVYNYGLILDTCDDVSSAISMYKEALGLNKNHLKAKINLSVLYMNLDSPKVSDALMLLREAYIAAPSNFEVNNNLGNAYVLNGDYSNAVIYFGNALNLEPNDKVVKQNLANAYLKAEDYGNAKTVYLEIVSDEPRNWQANLDLAKVYIQLHESDNALKYLEYLKANKPDFKASEVDNLLNALKK